jgi:hypothetical protein
MCSCLPKDAVPVVPAGERCAEGGGQPAVVATPAEIDVTNALRGGDPMAGKRNGPELGLRLTRFPFSGTLWAVERRVWDQDCSRAGPDRSPRRPECGSVSMTCGRCAG